MKTTIKHLESLCRHLNTLTFSPQESYVKTEGKHRAQVGNYHISRAYGGFCLQRMVNESGGVTCPLNNYHGPARELADQMRAFIAGIELQLELKSPAVVAAQNA